MERLMVKRSVCRDIFGEKTVNEMDGTGVEPVMPLSQRQIILYNL